ncbi:MAG: hypothetical protein ACK4J2_08225 [Sulfurihydrogenibium azorense]|uniref:hypothetical protein n=1 Tax=Sulfurihydrogenibium azorense TaxID=309806 RepID=UPI003919C5C2
MQMSLFQIPAPSNTQKKKKEPPKTQLKSQVEAKQIPMQTNTIQIINPPTVNSPKPEIKEPKDTLDAKYLNYKDDLPRLLAIIEDLLEKNL